MPFTPAIEEVLSTVLARSGLLVRRLKQILGGLQHQIGSNHVHFVDIQEIIFCERVQISMVPRMSRDPSIVGQNIQLAPRPCRINKRLTSFGVRHVCLHHDYFRSGCPTLISSFFSFNRRPGIVDDDVCTAFSQLYRD